jgi:hypothetical protein
MTKRIRAAIVVRLQALAGPVSSRSKLCRRVPEAVLAESNSAWVHTSDI